MSDAPCETQCVRPTWRDTQTSRSSRGTFVSLESQVAGDVKEEDKVKEEDMKIKEEEIVPQQSGWAEQSQAGNTAPPSSQFAAGVALPRQAECTASQSQAENTAPLSLEFAMGMTSPRPAECTASQSQAENTPSSSLEIPVGMTSTRQVGSSALPGHAEDVVRLPPTKRQRRSEREETVHLYRQAIWAMGPTDGWASRMS